MNREPPVAETASHGDVGPDRERLPDPGVTVVIATWGRPEQCEAAGYVRAVASLLPPPRPEALFALSEQTAIEEFAARGGLEHGKWHEVLCVWTFPDQESLLRGLMSTGFAVEAAAHAGEESVVEAVLESVAPYRMSNGSYRLENEFTYIVARI